MAPALAPGREVGGEAQATSARDSATSHPATAEAGQRGAGETAPTERVPEPVPDPAAGGEEGAGTPGEAIAGAPPFGSVDPHERARRLARALVSDIASYHRDRLDRGLREGSLRHELGPEIRKSWEEYTAQVGNQIARETSYFRDALNEILARGGRRF